MPEENARPSHSRASTFGCCSGVTFRDAPPNGELARRLDLTRRIVKGPPEKLIFQYFLPGIAKDSNFVV